MVYKKNNSGFVLVFSIFLLLFLGILLETASVRANIELHRSLSHLASQQAFYAAESGLQSAVSQLRINSNWIPGNATTPPAMTDVPLQINNNSTNNSPSTAVGFYTVEVQTAPPFEFFQSVWVKSTGKSSQTGFQPQITRSILARVVVESPTNFFLSTAGNLHVASGAAIDKDILGNNIYFDVNQSLPAAQRDINIGGNVFFLEGVNGNTNPAVTISGQTAQSPTETFSGVNTDSYRTIAQNGGSYSTGDLTVTGDISEENLKSSNGVVFAEGNIFISGTVQDSMLFVAGGNVYLNGDLVVPNGNDGTLPQNNTSAPQLGILAKQDVIIPASAPSDMTVDAFIMADGGPGSQGGILQAQGSKLSKGTINILGAMAFRGSGATSAVDLNVYSTRNYQYNTQFQNNVQIPFLPAIADIVTWQEVNFNCDFTLPIPTQSDQIPQANAC